MSDLTACIIPIDLIRSELAALNDTLTAEITLLTDALSLATEAPSCGENATGTYSRAYHIGAIFIILSVSALGVGSTLAGKHFRRLAMSPLTVALGKTMGTGVVLATALVHMLLPAHESLTNSCLPASFTEPYGALAFLFALLAVFAMQTVEFMIGNVLGVDGSQGLTVDCTDVNCPSEPALTIQHAVLDEGGGDNTISCSDCTELKASTTTVVAIRSPTKGGGGGGEGGADSLNNGMNEGEGEGDDFNASEERAPHAHAHSGIVVALINAVSAELAFTIHSIFIGLAVGMTNDDGLTALLVAICFHQFFEGVSLGARLVEAPLSLYGDLAFTAVFACSAPVGIAIGVSLVSSSSLLLSSTEYIITQGVFDAVCAGILLHIGFSMLVIDLPKDISNIAAIRSGKSAMTTNAALYAALWTGGGLMAFLGKYL